MRAYHLLIKERANGATQLYGATVGQEHLKQFYDTLAGDSALNGDGSGALVIIDFTGIESVTASYLKATVLTFLRAGISFAGGASAEGLNPLPPLNIFPAVTGLSAEIAEELGEVSISNRLVCLEALDFNGDLVEKARLLGEPDGSVVDTLELLVQEGSATATQLFEKNPTKGITVNGWNNRLADLYRLRLACRVKHGRQWFYTPVAKQVLHG